MGEKRREGERVLFFQFSVFSFQYFGGGVVCFFFFPRRGAVGLGTYVYVWILCSFLHLFLFIHPSH